MPAWPVVSSGDSSWSGPAGELTGSLNLGLLVKLAVFHHGQNAICILQNLYVGERVAVDEQDVRQIAFLDLAQLVGPQHHLAAEPGGADKRLHGGEPEVTGEIVK